MRAPSRSLIPFSQTSPLRCAYIVGARRSEGVSPIILISLRRALPLVIRVQPPKRSLRSSHLRQSTKESSRGWAEGRPPRTEAPRGVGPAEIATLNFREPCLGEVRRTTLLRGRVDQSTKRKRAGAIRSPCSLSDLGLQLCGSPTTSPCMRRPHPPSLGAGSGPSALDLPP